MTKTKTPHKHAALIKAWADGEAVQFLSTSTWKDINNYAPVWFEDIKYRIKPEPTIIRYRVAMYKVPRSAPRDGTHAWITDTVGNAADEANAEASSDFHHWITDWIEHEVKA